MKTLMGDVTVWRVRACAACLVYPSPLSPVSFLPLGLSALPLAPPASPHRHRPAPRPLPPPARSARTHGGELPVYSVYRTDTV